MQKDKKSNPPFDTQGHRGCRGLMPENTLEAFKHAYELGVMTLELDVCISKDKKVIISHEPYFNGDFCIDPEGNRISKEQEKNHNLYGLTYNEIKMYDTGSLFFEKFPKQKKIKTYKPSLDELVAMVNQLESKKSDLNPVAYNIEIKRNEAHDSIFHPEYKEFADLVINKIEALGISNRTTVQCFDIATLKYIRSTYPKTTLVYLIANENTVKENIRLLGFTPEIYSPHYKLVTPELVEFCKTKGMKLIPWTINDREEMKILIDLGVDGIITDYPDRLLSLI